MNEEEDFLIIGGGVAGVSAAASLAPLGRVTLLEAEDALAFHASGRSAAMFLKNYGNGTVRALNEASEEHHETADGGVLTPRGLIVIAREDGQEALATESEEAGLVPMPIDDALARVPILNPDTVRYAAFREDARDLDTHLLIQNFARAAKAAGATFVQKARVEAIERNGQGWRVTAGGQDYAARTIVNAAGAWADTIAGMAGVAPLGIVPHRRSMALMPAPGGHDLSDWPFFEEVGERWYAKPDAGRLIVSPADEDPTEPHDAWPDDMVIAEGLARYEEMVTEPVTRVEHSWAGLRSFAPDRALVIGRDAAQPDFFWLAGQGGYGFQTAPAAARLTADLLGGRPSDLPDHVVRALSPARFN